MVILLLLLIILIQYMVYWLIQNYGGKTAFKVLFVLNFIWSIVTNLSSLGIGFILESIISNAIGTLVSTIVSVWVYNKTASFFTYLLLLIVVSIALLMIIGMIFGAIGFAGLSMFGSMF